MTGIKNVLDEQFKFYQELYSKNNEFEKRYFLNFMEDEQIPRVKVEDLEKLESKFSLEELRKAVMQMKTGKVCRSDGLSIEFYQNSSKI